MPKQTAYAWKDLHLVVNYLPESSVTANDKFRRASLKPATHSSEPEQTQLLFRSGALVALATFYELQ